MRVLKENRYLEAILEDIKRADKIVDKLAMMTVDSVDLRVEFKNLERAMRAAREKYDSVEKRKFRADENLVKSVDADFVSLVHKYNSVTANLATKTALTGNSRKMDYLISILNMSNEELGHVEKGSENLKDYFERTTKGERTKDAIWNVVPNAIKGLIVAGAAAGLVAGGVQYADLQESYALVQKQSEEDAAARKEMEEKYNILENKYNDLAQNGGNSSGVSQEAYDKLQGEYNELLGKYNQSKADYETLNTKYSGLKAEYDEYMALIPAGQTPSAYIQGLLDQIAGYETRIEEYEATIAGLESAMVALNGRITDLEAQLEAALKDGTNQELIDQLRLQLKESNEQYVALEATHKETIAKHNKEVDGYKAAIGALEAELKTEKDKNAGLTEENAGLKEENAALEGEVEDLLSLIDSVYTQIFPDGKETGVANKAAAIVEYFQQTQSTDVRDFLIKFIAQLGDGAISVDELNKLTNPQLVGIANGMIGFPEGPTQNPNGNVHENGKPSSGNNSGSTEKEEEENDGTSNITPDLPPARE